MTVELQSKWTCNCYCGCGKVEYGTVNVYGCYQDESPEAEADQPRKGWAEMPKDITMCPECWNNIENGCTTIKGGVK